MLGKRIGSAFMAFVLAVGLCPALAFAEGSVEIGSSASLTTQSVIASGTDLTCEWSIDGQGRLTISPRTGLDAGQLNSYANLSVPWRDYKGKIREVYVSSGVQFGEDCTYMFSGCSNLESADLHNADVSSVKTMASLFADCSSLASVNIAGWETPSLRNVQSMFSGCSKLTELDLSDLNTASVTSMQGMFYCCSALKALNTSGWDTSSVENMAYMFNECDAFTSLDLHAWNVGAVSDFRGMFRDCEGLRYLNLAHWDTSQATNMSYMFSGCASLETIYVDDSWSTISLSRSSYTDGGSSMFYGCTRLVGEAGKPYSTGYDSRFTNSTYACLCEGFDDQGYLTRASFNIADSEVSIAPVNNTYTRSRIEPAVTVVLNSEELVRDVDYTVRYDDNVEVGTAKATVSGKEGGYYYGSKTVEFEIVSSDDGGEGDDSGNGSSDGDASGGASSGDKQTIVSPAPVPAAEQKAAELAAALAALAKAPAQAGNAPAQATAQMTVKGKTVKLKYAKVKRKKQRLSASKLFTVANAQGSVFYKKRSGSKKIRISTAGKVTVAKQTKKGTYRITALVYDSVGNVQAAKATIKIK